MKKVIFSIIFISLNLFAIDLDSKSDIKKLTESVMNEVSKNNVVKGVKILKPYIDFPIYEFEKTIAQIDYQQPLLKKRFGNSIGWDFIGEKKLGTTIIKYTYLQKYDNHVMIWYFIFYKPNTKWKLNSFKFHDKINLVFENN